MSTTPVLLHGPEKVDLCCIGCAYRHHQWGSNLRCLHRTGKESTNIHTNKLRYIISYINMHTNTRDDQIYNIYIAILGILISTNLHRKYQYPYQGMILSSRCLCCVSALQEYLDGEMEGRTSERDSQRFASFALKSCHFGVVWRW